MKTHIVIDGNAFYEVDEECLEAKKKQAEQQEALARRRRGQAADGTAFLQSKRRPGA